MSKQLKVIFTLSIILNLLCAGVGAGRFFHEVNEQKPWEQTKASLSDEAKGIMKETFKGKMKEVFPLFRQAHEQKMKMKDILVADQFDEDAYDVLAREMLDLSDKLSEHRMGTIKEFMLKLSKEDRVKIADHTVERMLGAPGGRDRSKISHHKRGKHSSEMNEVRRKKYGAIEKKENSEAFDAVLEQKNQ